MSFVATDGLKPHPHGTRTCPVTHMSTNDGLSVLYMRPWSRPPQFSEMRGILLTPVVAWCVPFLISKQPLLGGAGGEGKRNKKMLEEVQ